MERMEYCAMGPVGRAPGMLRRKEWVRLAAALGLSLLAHVAVICWPARSPAEGAVGGGALSVMLVSKKNPVVAEAGGVSLQGALPKAWSRRYFRTEELDSLPSVAPGVIGAATADGEVVVRLWLSRTGRVIRVEPVTAELAQSFIGSLRAHFLGRIYAPGAKAGIAVASVVEVVMRREEIAGSAG